MALASHRMAAIAGDRLALADDRVSLTWLELDGLLNRAANGLIRRSMGDERRAAVFAPNSSDAVVAYLACLHAGVSAVPVNPSLKAEELDYILRESGAEILFVGPETVELATSVAQAVGGVEVIGWRCAASTKLTQWEAWLADQSDAPPPDDMRPRRYLQFTSGTTGFPKAIDAVDTTLPQADSVAEFFETLRQWTAERPEGTHLCLGPLYFNASLTSVRILGAGNPLVVMTKFDAERALELIERFRIVTTLMVPTHFKRLLSLPQSVRDRFDVGSLKVVTHTGAACPPEVKRAMIDWFGPVLVEAYGGTESGTTNIIYSDEWLAHPGSVGRTIAPFELQIFSEDGARLGPNEPGQIFFRDTRGRGIVYRGDPEKTRAAHREPGVFTLGDVGYYDEEGFLYITDRVSDMIVSGGVNIYPAEIEHILVAHPAIVDAVVIGVPNADLGEEAKALVIPRDPEAPPEREELFAYLRGQLAAYKCPRSIDFVEDVGRNPAGKVNKRQLRAPYWPSDRTIG